MRYRAPQATQNTEGSGSEILTGGGELGSLMRAFDWTASPFGPVETWHQSLKTVTKIMLGSRYPIVIWYGPEMTMIYNDAYIPVLGPKHPWGLGKSAPVAWADIWDVIGPMLESVMKEGKATWREQLLLVMDRLGFKEETYFTFSYSPVPDDTGGIGGIFCACTEDTKRVLSERRLKTLRELAASTVKTRTVDEVCSVAAESLGANRRDLPFALFYLLDDEHDRARLKAASACKSWK